MDVRSRFREKSVSIFPFWTGTLPFSLLSLDFRCDLLRVSLCSVFCLIEFMVLVFDCVCLMNRVIFKCFFYCDLSESLVRLFFSDCIDRVNGFICMVFVYFCCFSFCFFGYCSLFSIDLNVFLMIAKRVLHKLKRALFLFSF